MSSLALVLIGAVLMSMKGIWGAAIIISGILILEWTRGRKANA